MLKVIEVMEESPESWEDATRKAVKGVAKTVKQVKSAWVKEFSTVVSGDEVRLFRVTLKITFEVERD